MADRKLGFGLMRLPLTDPNDEKSIDIEQAKKMVDIFMERGFTYFDTAWMYHEFCSEAAVKEILTDRYPRESYTVTTKLHSDFISSREDCDRIFNEQLKKTGLDYFDYYWLHDVNAKSIGKYEDLGCIEWIQEKKAQGLVKHIGFSFHDNSDVLRVVLEECGDVFEYVQLQINYLDWENSGIDSKRCYEVATEFGKPVIVMEPVKGGTLARVPEEVEKLFKAHDPEASIPSWAIRFVASLPNVYMVLSGMSNIEQMLDNTSFMTDFRPVDEDELEIIGKAAKLINANIAIPCTGCEYCTTGCPMGIPIPRYFALYNADKQEIEGKEWTPQQEYYGNLTVANSKASDCIGCGHCEAVCPQHLHIIDHLKEVAEHFEQ